MSLTDPSFQIQRVSDPAQQSRKPSQEISLQAEAKSSQLRNLNGASSDWNNRTISRKNSRQKLAASAFQPVYLGRYPVPIPPVGAYEDFDHRQQPAYESDYGTDDHPIGSFYSLDEPSTVTNTADSSYKLPNQVRFGSRESLEPILLQSYDLGLSAQSEQTAKRFSPKQTKTEHVTLKDHASPDLSSNAEQKLKYAKKKRVVQRARSPIVSQPPNMSSVLPVKLVSHPQLKVKTNNQRAKLDTVYRPSILRRPKPMNLTSLLEPGQVLLSKQTGANAKPSVSSVSVKEIEALLRRLKSLTVREDERPESELPKMDLEQDHDVDDETTIDKDDLGEMNSQNGNSLLPTSHLFGGLSSIVGESRTSEGASPELRGTISRGSINIDSNKASKPADSDEKALLDSLKDLSSKLGENSRDSDNDAEVDEIDNVKLIDDDFFRSNNNDGRSARERRTSSSQNEETLLQPTIPINVLVDHLLSNSRKASFGIQHRDVGDGYDGDESPEEDDETDDQDNNDTLPPEAHIEANESSLKASTLDPDKNLTFSSILDKTGSWIPLKSIHMKGNGRLPTRHQGGTGLATKKIKQNRKGVSPSSGLIISGKRLSRTDLIRLIWVLNRMASKREPSKEREASRKLLRYLIKLALDDYKRSKLLENSSNRAKKSSSARNSTNQHDPIRDLLRSILMSPIDAKQMTDKGSSVIELHPLGLSSHQTDNRSQQETVNSLLNDGSENHSEGQPSGKRRRGVSLSKLSDDLEQYFDSDFFEDLADRANNTSAGRGNYDRIDSTTRQLPRYKLPVSIYSQQSIDAADEEDVDFDNVRIVPQLKRTKPQVSRRSIQKSSFRGSDRRSNDEKDDDDEVDDETVGSKGRRARRRSASGIGGSGNQSEVGLSQKSGKKDDDNDEVDDKVDDEVEEAQPQEQMRKQSEEVEDDEQESSPDSKGENQAETPIIRNDSSGSKMANKNFKSKKRHRRGRKRRRKLIDSGKVSLAGPREIDIDSRDEIPAPIVAGHSINKKSAPPTLKRHTNQRAEDSNTSRGYRKFNTNKTSPELTNRKLDGRLESGSKLTKSNHTASGKQKSVTREADRLSQHDRSNRSTRRALKGSKMKLNAVGDSDVPSSYAGEPKDDDDDYYNEGTSYEKVCDDDGECKVKVLSNSPKINKVLRSGNKPAIDKHLKGWISEPD